ncbi:dihydrolipoyl dehydrogenase [Bacillus sp. ISL-47]|uniref:dihydrolipoyl dehydrogenase n=1 Tax=Bacillus sp. ISL-47 TaxID=2819130 RepID=UPI001BEA0196|nr:dihydrolipoyl dehydrogenase [Bacillus sp. ISL-47]MBT2688180.1 dihydrolipoyl dehydrogenase [Bacillus sp. ISL-47]MBT2708466.1 dihydrolipoyl dehydrogenase [Pseudomonas sp. ISL-84]
MVVGELAYERDVIIIGGGPGGYHAAIRAAQLGRTVTLIERGQLGGVCLNKGCIPSKILTQAAEKAVSYQEAENWGFEAKAIHFNMKKLQEYKQKTVEQLRAGIEALCKANKVEIVEGSAFFLAEDKVGVENGEKYEVFRFKDAIIATGSTPVPPAWLQEKSERLLDTQSIANLNEIPEKLLVYGSDYIALEIGMAYQALGADVTLILDEGKAEFEFDQSICRELKRILKKKGLNVVRNVDVLELQLFEDNVSLILEAKGKTKTLSGTYLFSSASIKPNTDQLGLNRIGVEISTAGFIKVDHQCRTSRENIYAIGDVTEGPALAVKAIKQGKTAAEAIAGIASESDFRFIPVVAHTQPPIAGCGLTEEEAINLGYDIEIGQYPLSSNGYSTLIGKKDGFIKVISDKEKHVLLGFHMVGHGAVELISSGITALEMAARDEDLIFPHYPHPSMNEGLLEAVEALKKQAVHLPPGLIKERLKV